MPDLPVTEDIHQTRRINSVIITVLGILAFIIVIAIIALIVIVAKVRAQRRERGHKLNEKTPLFDD